MLYRFQMLSSLHQSQNTTFGKASFGKSRFYIYYSSLHFNFHSSSSLESIFFRSSQINSVLINLHLVVITSGMYIPHFRLSPLFGCCPSRVTYDIYSAFQHFSFAISNYNYTTYLLLSGNNSLQPMNLPEIVGFVASSLQSNLFYI